MAFPTKLTDKQRAHIIATGDQQNASELAKKYKVATGTIYAVRHKAKRQAATKALFKRTEPALTPRDILKQEYPKDPTPELVQINAQTRAKILLRAVRPYLDGAKVEGGYLVVHLPLTHFFPEV